MAELISRRCQGTSLQHTYEHDKQDVSALLSVPIAGPVHAASGAIILYNYYGLHIRWCRSAIECPPRKDRSPLPFWHAGSGMPGKEVYSGLQNTWTPRMHICLLCNGSGTGIMPQSCLEGSATSPATRRQVLLSQLVIAGLFLQSMVFCSTQRAQQACACSLPHEMRGCQTPSPEGLVAGHDAVLSRVLVLCKPRLQPLPDALMLLRTTSIVPDVPACSAGRLPAHRSRQRCCAQMRSARAAPRSPQHSSTAPRRSGPGSQCCRRMSCDGQL